MDFESKLILNKNNLKELGFPTERFSLEISNTNNYGYRLMELCKSLDVHIVNGRFGTDSYILRQTCKNSSVIDYVIMSAELFPCVHSFEELEFDPLLSDIHCPVAHNENTPMQYTEIFYGRKNDNFQMKIFDIFLIFAQNIDCGFTLEPPPRGGSNEYPQSMFWSKNKKNMYTRVNPTFSI